MIEGVMPLGAKDLSVLRTMAFGWTGETKALPGPGACAMSVTRIMSDFSGADVDIPQIRSPGWAKELLARI